MKKKYIVLLLLVCIILGGGLFAIRGTLDRTAPEIIFPTAQAAYHKEDTEETLLKGVTAYDDTDGDVTDNLIIENVFVDDAEGAATVVYVAKDSNNNITKATRQMSWDPAEAETETESETETEPKTEVITEKKGSDETESESETENVQSVSSLMHAAQTEMESDTEAETVETITEISVSTEPQISAEELDEDIDLDAYYEEAFAQLPSYCPRLRLTDRKLAITVGDEFDPLIYVQSIEDDYDNKYELWRQISIEGEVNTQIPGIYQLIYSASDSSGNSSNRAMLLVEVQGEYKNASIPAETGSAE